MTVEQVSHRSLVEPIDVDVRDPRVPPPLAAGSRPGGNLQRLESVRRRPYGNLLERERRKGRGHQAELHRCTSTPDVTGPSSDRYILHRTGAMGGGPNRPRPGTQPGEGQAPLHVIGDVDALAQLAADRV